VTVVQTSRPPVPRSVKEEVAYRRSSRCGSSSSGDREVASGDERLVWRTPATPAPVPSTSQSQQSSPYNRRTHVKRKTNLEIEFATRVDTHSLSPLQIPTLLLYLSHPLPRFLRWHSCGNAPTCRPLHPTPSAPSAHNTALNTEPDPVSSFPSSSSSSTRRRRRGQHFSACRPR